KFASRNTFTFSENPQLSVIFININVIKLYFGFSTEEIFFDLMSIHTIIFQELIICNFYIRWLLCSIIMPITCHMIWQVKYQNKNQQPTPAEPTFKHLNTSSLDILNGN
ncbi:hypothetical protein, partial [Yersinia pestis]